MQTAIIPTPLGHLALVADETHLLSCQFTHKDLIDPCTTIMRDATTQLNEYFSGKRKAFSLPIKLSGTPFQIKIWQILSTIPYGECWSYQKLASKTPSPKAYRAAGSANGKNTMCIIIPCHRVIRQSGALGGYRYGAQFKKWLITHEQSGN